MTSLLGSGVFVAKTGNRVPIVGDSSRPFRLFSRHPKIFLTRAVVMKTANVQKRTFSEVASPNGPRTRKQCKVATEALQLQNALRSQTESPFLRLPAELRNKIYNYALGHLTVYGEATHSALTVSISPASSGNPLALLQVCRQIHAEAALIPYRLSTFGSRSDEASGFYRLIRTLSGAQRNTITTIRLDYRLVWWIVDLDRYGPPGIDARRLSILRDLSNLKTVELVQSLYHGKSVRIPTESVRAAMVKQLEWCSGKGDLEVKLMTEQATMWDNGEVHWVQNLTLF